MQIFQHYTKHIAFDDSCFSLKFHYLLPQWGIHKDSLLFQNPFESNVVASENERASYSHLIDQRLKLWATKWGRFPRVQCLKFYQSLFFSWKSHQFFRTVLYDADDIQYMHFTVLPFLLWKCVIIDGAMFSICNWTR